MADGVPGLKNAFGGSKALVLSHFHPCSDLKRPSQVGVSDRNCVTPWDFVEECWREDLEPISKRRLAVLDPLEVVTGLH